MTCFKVFNNSDVNWTKTSHSCLKRLIRSQLSGSHSFFFFQDFANRQQKSIKKMSKKFQKSIKKISKVSEKYQKCVLQGTVFY